MGIWGQRHHHRRDRDHRRYPQPRLFSSIAIALTLFALFSCGQAANPWRLDSIATNSPSSDSSRLIYSTPSSHLKLEFLRIGTETFAYLFLQQHRFAPGHAELSLTIDGTTTQELLPVRDGSMRLKLPKEITSQIISALQDGKEVAILLDGFQQTISPSFFQERYKEFVGGTMDFFQFIKGPLK